MARKPKIFRWSYKEERRVLDLARKSRSAEEIAHLMNRSPAVVRRLAIRLGVPLNKSTPTERLKAARKTKSTEGKNRN